MSEPNPLERLISTYHDLNAAVVDELYEEPSALEFMRYVARNRPFIVHGAAREWKACQCWSAEYLRTALRDCNVNVAVTPLGNADAVVERDDCSLAFVEPCEVPESFSSFLEYVVEDTAASRNGRATGNVKYAQTQNDNLREEYRVLFEDVPKDIPFARIALEKGADAVNFWLGNHRSVTALHKDNYENIYVQIVGQKHFVLMPPVQMPSVNEQSLPRGRYAPREKGGEDLVVQQAAEEAELVPVPTWDPDEPETRPTSYSKLAGPLRVTLSQGDMLYLPAMWFHKVSQTEGDEGFACAVNYWYDMDFAGGFWAGNSFIRDVALAETQAVQ